MRLFRKKEKDLEEREEEYALVKDIEELRRRVARVEAKVRVLKASLRREKSA